MKITLRESLVVIVFHSGKIIITGAKTREEIIFAEKTIFEKIRQSVNKATT
jgi:TATA-box binding protein (TBP) (component of TFIID and TFIIIB)